MSNYIWTENQIQAAIKKGKKRSQEDWLRTNIFRIGNKRDSDDNKADSSDLRMLMSLLVEREFAFDNGVDITGEDYKISFNWAEKDRLTKKLEIPRFFSPGLFAWSGLSQLPPEEYLMFCQNDQKRKTAHSIVRFRWGVIVSTLRVLDDTGKLGLDPSLEEHLDKDDKEMILGIAEEVACMYKAFEIGWDDIKVHYPNLRDHNALFVGALRERSRADFEDCVNPPSIKIYADIKHVQNISSVFEFVLNLFSKIPGTWAQNLREILSENSLFQEASKLDSTYKDSKALLNKSPWQKEYTEKIIFIISVLLKSPNPEVRKAALNWIKAAFNPFKVAKRLIRRETQTLAS
jgi:hypothetical protein